MKKMMVLTLALSVMMVGNAMAMSGAEANDRGPGRVKIDVNFGGKEHPRYIEMVHIALCPECRDHLVYGCDACRHHTPHHPKMHKGNDRGGKWHPDNRHNPNDRGNDRGGKHNDDRGNDRGNGHNGGHGNGRR